MKKGITTILIIFTLILSAPAFFLAPVGVFAATGGNTPQVEACIPSIGITTGIKWSLKACIADIGQMFLWIASLATAAGGKALDTAIEYSIMKMNTFINGGAGNDTMVEIGWTIFRDLANIAFIFLILWIAIQTILGLGSSDPTGQIGKIILAGLLINFSLFIGEAVIDASNIIAVHFWDLLNPPGGSISAVFGQALALSTIYDSSGLQSLDFIKIITISAFGIIFLLVACWIFLALAMLFLVRTVILALVLVLSPLAFISWVIPSQRGNMTRWWDTLLKQSFFAPIAMIMLYILGRAVQTNAGIGVPVENKSISTAFASADGIQTSSSVGGIVINFAVITMMLIASAVVATSVGAYGSSTVRSWGQRLKGRALSRLKYGGDRIREIGNRGLGATGKGIEDKWGERLKTTNSVFGRFAKRTLARAQKTKVFGGRSYEEQKEGGGFFKAGKDEIQTNVNKLQSDPQKLADYFAKLGAEQRKMVFKDMSVRNRALLDEQGKIRARKGDTEIQDSLSQLVSKLDKDSKEKLEDEIRRVAKRTTDREVEDEFKALAKALADTTKSASGNTNKQEFEAGNEITINVNGVDKKVKANDVQSKMAKISPKALEDFDEEAILAIAGVKDNTGKYMFGGGKTAQLLESGSLNDEVKKKIKEIRYKALEDLVNKTGKNATEEAELARMINELDQKEAQFIEETIITKQDFIKNINASLLQGLIKAGEKIENIDKIEEELERIGALKPTIGSNTDKALKWLKANRHLVK